MNIIRSIKQFLVICFLPIFLFISCDGKPPKMVEEKTTNLLVKKEEETELGLFNKRWASDTLWQNGTIEKIRYRVFDEESGKSYEEIWETRSTLFSKQFYNESTDSTRKDLFSTMTLSRQRFATNDDLTSFSLQVSILTRDYFEPVRLQFHGHENGKMTSKILKRLMGRTVIYTHCYQGEFGDGEIELGKEIFLEEQLPLSLRAINFNLQVEGGITFYRSTYSSLSHLEYEAPALREVEYHVGTIDSLDLNGKIQLAIPITANFTGRGGTNKTDRYWFDSQFPHSLLQAEWDNGLTLKIISKEYLAPRK
ncbi:MAG: hypothetical protein SFU91_09845 [Chloroherpetonaceae bacterium]|nr:hypothetical protein [Chloroherpetonaceae bacterium]